MLGGGAVQAPDLKWGWADWLEIWTIGPDTIWPRTLFHLCPQLKIGGRSADCLSVSPPLPRPLFYLLDFAVLPQNWSNLPPVASENLKTEGGADSLCSSIWGHQRWRSDCTQQNTRWTYIVSFSWWCACFTFTAGKGFLFFLIKGPFLTVYIIELESRIFEILFQRQADIGQPNPPFLPLHNKSSISIISFSPNNSNACNVILTKQLSAIAPSSLLFDTWCQRAARLRLASFASNWHANNSQQLAAQRLLQRLTRDICSWLTRQVIHFAVDWHLLPSSEHTDPTCAKPSGSQNMSADLL